MKYINGLIVQEGDRVLIEQGLTPGRVRTIVETSDEMRQWNVDEPGLLIESAPFGLVFWPASSPDSAAFVTRASGSTDRSDG